MTQAINLDPALYDYQDPPNVCPSVYGLNLTPDTIFLSFNEIQKGDTWISADLEPPNGLWLLNPDAPCEFRATPGGAIIGYDTRLGGAAILFQTPNSTLAFVGTAGTSGVTWFDNIFVNPSGRPFYGGWCSVTSVVSSNQNNIQDLWESLGQERSAAQLDFLRVQNDQTSSHTFSDPKDATRIHITVDDS